MSSTLTGSSNLARSTHAGPAHASVWLFELERGPSCLYVHPIRQPLSALDSDSDSIESRELDACGDQTGELDGADELGVGFCDAIWALMDQHLSSRVVLELDQLDAISPQLVNELIQLHQRVEAHSGIVRICGLCEQSREMLSHSDVGRITELGFATRDEALMAGRAGRPR